MEFFTYELQSKEQLISIPHFWSTVRRKRSRFGHMQTVIRTSRRIRGLFAWSSSELWSCFRYSELKSKKSKTYSVLCPFQGLFNGTTLMQIQSGQTVPLKAYSCESSFFHIKSKYLCFISRFYYAIVAAYLYCTITFLVEHVASFPKFLFESMKSTQWVFYMQCIPISSCKMGTMSLNVVVDWSITSRAFDLFLGLPEESSRRSLLHGWQETDYVHWGLSKVTISFLNERVSQEFLRLNWSVVFTQ